MGYQGRTIYQTTQSNAQASLQANHIKWETGYEGSVSLKNFDIRGRDQDKVKTLVFRTQNLSIKGSADHETFETRGWGVNVGYDFITETPSIGRNYTHDTTYTTMHHQQRQFQVDHLDNERQGTKVEFIGAIQANIDESTGEEIKVYVDHPQDKKGQKGVSVGGNIGVENFGIHGSYKTGEKATNRDLTKVNIGGEGHIEREDRHYEKGDSRWGLGGGVSLGRNNVGIDGSLELGDNKINGGFSLGKNGEGELKNSFNVGFDIEGVKLGIESDMFETPHGESALSRGAQWVDKGFYGLQQACNLIESGHAIAQYFDAEGLNINQETLSEIQYYLNLCRQGIAATVKISNTQWSKNFSNKVVAYLSSNTCAYHGLEHLFSNKSFQELASEAGLGVNFDGVTLSQIEKIAKTQQQKGTIHSYHIQDIQGEGNLLAHLNQLDVSKASFILHDPRRRRDHMVMLQKNDVGLWGACDVKGDAHILIDLQSLEYSKGSLFTINTSYTTSCSDYDRKRQVYVGASKRENQEKNNIAKIAKVAEDLDRVAWMSETKTGPFVEGETELIGLDNPLKICSSSDFPKRTGKHRQVFKKATGCTAGEYMEHHPHAIEGETYHIGHIKEYAQHGPVTDQKDNLTIMTKGANQQMIPADNTCPFGYLNYTTVEKKPGTQKSEMIHQTFVDGQSGKIIYGPEIIFADRTSFDKKENKMGRQNVQKHFEHERFDPAVGLIRLNPSSDSPAQTAYNAILREREKNGIQATLSLERNNN